jgi:hypothetical protein
VENSIIMKANKVMVARSAGTASVFGYNYSDDGFILGSEGWIEVGVNASHMVGPHHVLSDGNVRLQLRLGQDARQRHLPHRLPQPPQRDPPGLR